MRLISVIKAKNGWRIEHEGRGDDKTPIKIKYPSVSDFGLGVPSRDFLQAVSKFLRIAIAIGHLDYNYWLDYGSVVAIKFKESKDDNMLQITVESSLEETVTPLQITTPYAAFFSVMAILQSTDPTAYSLSLAVTELEQQVEKYIAGERRVEQLELIKAG